MFAGLAQITSASDAVSAPQFVVADVNNHTELATSLMFQRVAFERLRAGNLIPVMTQQPPNAVGFTFASLQPTQVILRVAADPMNGAVLVDVVYNLYDDVINPPAAPNNPAPPDLLRFTMSRVVVARGVTSGGIGSTHSFSELSAPFVYIITNAAISRAGPFLATPRIAALGGVTGVPGPDPQLPAIAPTPAVVALHAHQGQLPAAGVGIPVAYPPQDNSREQERRSHMLAMIRLLTRDGPAAPGALSPREFVDSIVGPYGKHDGPTAFAAVSARWQHPISGIQTEGRLPYLESNFGLVMAFCFVYNAVTVSKDGKLNGLNLNVFCETTAAGALKYPTRVAHLYARAVEIVHAYECLLKNGLPPNDRSIRILFQPLLDLLDASSDDTKVLNNTCVDLDALSREIDLMFWKLRLLLVDPASSLPGFTWQMVVDAAHAIFKAFDAKNFVTQCLLFKGSHLGTPSRAKTAATAAAATAAAAKAAAAAKKAADTAKRNAKIHNVRNPQQQGAGTNAGGGSSTSAAPTNNSVDFGLYGRKHSSLLSGVRERASSLAAPIARTLNLTRFSHRYSTSDCYVESGFYLPFS